MMLFPISSATRTTVPYPPWTRAHDPRTGLPCGLAVLDEPNAQQLSPLLWVCHSTLPFRPGNLKAAFFFAAWLRFYSVLSGN